LRILFLSDNFPPEVNAPATRTYEHSREWVAQGHEVTVITCAPNFPKGKLYDGYRNDLSQTEVIDGIKVIRVWSLIASNRGTLIRILDFISFAMMAFWRSLFIKTDIIVATSPQFFPAVTAYLLSIIKWRPWIFEVRDLWPESIKTVGAIESIFIFRLLEKLELFLYRRANHIIVVTDSFKKDLHARGISRDKISTIKNGINRNDIHITKSRSELRKELSIPEDAVVLGYIGTHGMAHGLDFIVRQAKDNDEVIFLFIGEGAVKRELLKLKDELSLSNIVMIDAVPKQSIYSYINMIDIALINLKKSDTFKKVIPSKIFENAALQRPILLGVEGEAKSIVQHYQAGLAFIPEDAEDFKLKLNQLRSDKKLYSKCQMGGIKLAKSHDRKSLANEMLVVMMDTI